MAGPRAVVLSRQVKNGKEPRLQSCKHRRRRSAAMSKGSNDRGQASGGARDWNGARRGAIKTTAEELKCSTDRATNGTGSCGAGGRNEGHGTREPEGHCGGDVEHQQERF
jgi:hypothetical protein